MRKEQTSSKECSLGPVHGQHAARAETDALREVDASPEVHGQNTAAEAEAAEIEDGRVADVRQAAEMLVLEGFVDDVVDVAVFDLVGSHAGERGCDLGEFAA